MVGPLACLAAFVALTWVRAESLAVMLPAVVNVGLGLGTGLLGHSLTYWVARLGVPVAHACPVAKALKLTQIVGVPAGYLLLGGQMPALPLLGATVALAALGWAHRRGQGCGRPV